jgi:hypothetical protein
MDPAGCASAWAKMLLCVTHQGGILEPCMCSCVPGPVSPRPVNAQHLSTQGVQREDVCVHMQPDNSMLVACCLLLSPAGAVPRGQSLVCPRGRQGGTAVRQG